MEYKLELKSDEEQKIEAERQLSFIDEAREIVTELSASLGRPLYAICKTFGCQMNAETVTTCS